ncbi:MAG: RluA family pseudouridine synthase [Bacteroidales bacterium]|nr:RluA family pseudouridine synthase [Bacteroidales bacterium]
MHGLEILYEDNHIIAINKKCSDIVQDDKTGDKSLKDKVSEYIKIEYNKPGNVFLGVIHRIDRPVSGVVLFAKTSKALSRFNELFKNKEIQKSYWAIVKKNPPNVKDTLIHYLTRNQKKNKSTVHDREVANSKKAILDYELIKTTNNYYLLEIDLKTGRHHQIRAQMAKIGCPIKGDLKYGYQRSNKTGGIHLHACKISFIHPVKKEHITINAPPPNDVLWNELV